jgi:murein DD-endopeptidase MepM/ murein hydrolase activator NlpD
MSKKFYNIIIVPHASAKFRKIKIPQKYILTSCAILILLLAITIYLVCNYYHMKSRIIYMDQVIAENNQLKSENVRFKESTELLSQKISEMNDYAKKLNIIAGIEPEKDQSLFGGIGDLSSESAKKTEDVLNNDIPHLKSKAFVLENNLHYLLTHFEKQSLLLASTPSIWPVRGYLSSYFGRRKDPFTGQREFHPGIDISSPTGTPVVAPADGIVAVAAKRGGFGNFIIIKHKYGYITRFGHLLKFNVRKGQRVKRGQIIGYLGNTGRSRGPHLHYEVLRNGKAENPLHYIIEKYKSFDY